MAVIRAVELTLRNEQRVRTDAQADEELEGEDAGKRQRA
jgi:hypothetical protein